MVRPKMSHEAMLKKNKEYQRKKRAKEKFIEEELQEKITGMMMEGCIDGYSAFTPEVELVVDSEFDQTVANSYFIPWSNHTQSTADVFTSESFCVTNDQRNYEECITNGWNGRPIIRTIDEFPSLTPEMELIIDSELKKAVTKSCVVKLDNHSLNSADISSLNVLNWCNEQVIDFYLALIVDRSKLSYYPSIYAYSTSFSSALRSNGEFYVTRWTKYVNIFAYDILLVPFFAPFYKGWDLEHWTLAIINNRLKKIEYYDPLGYQDEKCLQLLQNYLVAELKVKQNLTMDPNTYTIEIVKSTSRPMCVTYSGMLILKYAECVSRRAEITFTEKHMTYFRRRMLYEVLTKQLFA